jgi:hypothetical protein
VKRRYDYTSVQKSHCVNLGGSKEVGLEVNAEKVKYMETSRHQNARQIHDIKMANISFENVAKMEHFGTTLTNQNYIHEEIEIILNSENAAHNSLQNILLSRLLYKTVKPDKIIIFPVVLCGCVTSFLILREDRRRRVFNNKVLRRIFRPKR